MPVSFNVNTCSHADCRATEGDVGGRLQGAGSGDGGMSGKGAVRLRVNTSQVNLATGQPKLFSLGISILRRSQTNQKTASTWLT